ncbi:MAG: peptidoglycan-binding protein [Phycisphaeraceae bacterium]|nr:peptidoglycan-binding protein [Phycisphaeraceae bacterium]
MPRCHKVRKEECIESIAFDYGFFPETIWEHADNAALRELRGSMNLLVPGDEVQIPDLTEKEVGGAVDTRHRFRRKGVPARFQVRFLDEDGEPIADVAYKTTIDGAVGPEGRTDADGWVDIAVPPDAIRLTLVLETDHDWAKESEFVLSNLEPVDTLKGVQARLRSLGYFEAEVNGEDTEELRQAVRSFQRANSLEESGEPGETAVHDALVSLYGC